MIIVGAGRSLTGFDFKRLEGKGYVVGVNEAIWDLPFASACISADVHWMNRRADFLPDLAARLPLYLAIPDDYPKRHVPGAIHLHRRRENTNTLSEDPTTLEFGGTSGFGALGLSYLKRARRMILFGFDYLDTGEPHYCPERYDWHPPGHNTHYWPGWAKHFRGTLAQIARANISVVVAGPHSNIDAFPRVSHEQAFRELEESK